MQCAENGAVTGHRFRRGRRLTIHDGVRAELCQAKVEQRRPGLREDYVPGLQITVDDPGFVGSGKCVGDVDAVLEGLVERELATREPGGERLPIQVLHDEEVGPVLMANVEQRTDVRVRQGGYGAGLTLESLPCRSVIGEVRRKHLDGDGPLKPRVTRLPHLAHPACAYTADDLIWAEPCTGIESHHLARLSNERMCPLGVDRNALMRVMSSSTMRLQVRR